MTEPALAELLPELTRMPAKAVLYQSDTYVAESVDAATDAGVDPCAFAHQHGLLFLKPDAIAARGVGVTVNWLADNDFRIVAAQPISANRHLVRALWYFQWNIASWQRRRLADILVELSDSLLLVVTDIRPSPVPASVRLTELKGPTAPRDREPGQLRHLLGGDTYLLNMVHSTDEPADVLRELSIYLHGAALRQVLDDITLGLPQNDHAVRLGDKLYSTVPERSFDRSDAYDVLAEQLSDVDSAAPPEVQALTDRLRSPESMLKADWAVVIQTCWRHGWPMDDWASLLIGAAVLPMRIPHGEQIIGAASPDAWMATATAQPAGGIQ